MIKPKDFQNVNQKYIQLLIENGIEESIHLDYKKKLGLNAEIAKDLSSFANTDGGNIIYGIKEKNNKPKEIVLIQGNNIREKIDQIASFGVDPPLNVRILPIDITLESEKGQIFLVYIPKSYPKIHQAKKKDKYYKRTEFTSTPMFDSEIKLAFEIAYESHKRIQEFKDKRIEILLKNQSFVEFLGNSKIIIHLIPETSLHPSIHYDLQVFEENYSSSLRPMNCYNPVMKWYGEGLLVSCKNNNPKPSTYIFLYNDGIIESVESQLIQPTIAKNKNKEYPLKIKRCNFFNFSIYFG